MNNRNKEIYIIKACLETLRGLLGRNMPVHLEEQGHVRGPDFTVTLNTHPPVRLIGECKANIATRAQAYHVMLQTRAYAAKNEQVLVFAKWIPEMVGEEFRKNGVFFADMLGNAYFHHPPQIVVDVRGRRPEARPGPEPGRIVETAGLKVCHALLTRPHLLKRPMREIAQEACVALGTAHIILKELTAAGWLIPGKDNQRRFADVKAVIDAFVRGYAFKLRPACLIGRFRHKKGRTDDILQVFQARLADTNAQWGLTGGLAARELTKYLEPNTVTVFADEKAEERLKTELFPDRNGNITLLRLFAPTVLGETARNGMPMATPLLTYAELLNEGGPRELETAEMILGKYILPGVGLEPRAA
jgi:hypothetical protein